MDVKESTCHLKCRSCSKVVENAYDDLAAIVCRHCGTLQYKEETIFETPPNFISPTRDISTQNSPSVKRFIAKISNLTNTLNLPYHLTDKAIELAQRVFEDDILKKQKNGPKMAACIHYVTRSNGYAIPIKKLSISAQTPMSHVSKCLNLCIKRLQLEPLPYLNYVSFLERFSESLEDGTQGIVINWSKEVEDIVKITTDGTSSAIVAAALLKVVLEGRDTHFNFTKLCSNFSMNYENVKNTASKVRRKLFSFSQDIPWKPSTLAESNITSFLPEILKYHRQYLKDSKLQQISNDDSCFQETVKLVLDLRSKDEKHDIQNQSDPVFRIIWDLLDKGCSEEEMLSQNLSVLSQKYLDHTIDSNVYDCEIPDEEIEELLK